jgi:hypothetical protein
MRRIIVLSLLVALTGMAPRAAHANPIFGIFAQLQPGAEVPPVSSGGSGVLRGSYPIVLGFYDYRLRLSNLKGQVIEVDLQFAQPGVNGGVIVVLCSNLGTAPAGTQPCPSGAAPIRGSIHAADVVGPASQGIAAGDLDALSRAIHDGLVHVNVRTDLFPGGELRGQISTYTISPD